MKDILCNSIYKKDLSTALRSNDLTELKNKTILITGGLGLICSSIVDLLHKYNVDDEANIRILVADINEPFFGERFGRYDDIKFIKYNALEPIAFDFDIDYIIHGAGLSSPELFVNKPVETMLSNFNGVLNLLNYSKRHRIKRMLYISSSEVYGNKSNEHSFMEDDFGSSSINTIRASYSESKRASEVLCRSFYAEYNVETIMVRPGHIFGPTASPKDQRVSSAFAFLAASGKSLELKSSGLIKRSYCYSIDCAVAILIVLLKGEAGESYNIGNDEVITIKQMASIIADAGKVPLNVAEPTDEELKAFNPMNNSSLSNDKIKKIGYCSSFSAKTGLEHTVKIIKQIYYNDLDY